jgi:hypothetical protein
MNNWRAAPDIRNVAEIDPRRLAPQILNTSVRGINILECGAVGGVQRDDRNIL